MEMKQWTRVTIQSVVSVSNAMDALKTLCRFFECKSGIQSDTFSNLANIDQVLQDTVKTKQRQSKITFLSDFR
jgi:hypothetical protein